MEPYTLEHALMEHLDTLIDAPWSPHVTDSNDLMRPSAGVDSGNPTASLRPLAPAAVAGDTRGKQSRRMSAPEPPPPLREQDRLLPMTNVARLMASELPKDAKVSKESKLLMQELVTEFICFVTSEANDYATQGKRKAISMEDHMNSFESLDLGSYLPLLEAAMNAMSSGSNPVSPQENRCGQPMPLSADASLLAHQSTIQSTIQSSMRSTSSTMLSESTSSEDESGDSDLGKSWKSDSSTAPSTVPSVSASPIVSPLVIATRISPYCLPGNMSEQSLQKHHVQTHGKHSSHQFRRRTGTAFQLPDVC